MESKNQRLCWIINRETPLFYCILSICFFFSTFVILSTTKTTPCQDRIRCQVTTTKSDTIYVQKILSKKVMIMPKSPKSTGPLPMSLVARSTMRRFLGGPGSWPPRCMSKCGRCAPCRPVHVPVSPGTPVTTEYYPEAWRCKCGNRLFMP